MKTHAAEAHEQTRTDVAQRYADEKPGGAATRPLADRRPEAGMYRSLQRMASDSARAAHSRAFQQIADNSPRVAQRQAMADMAAGAAPRQENRTGLPDNLKSGVERMSGYSMDDVKVHYNSARPARLRAHAYTQGTDIYLAAGQERHLPHEAWHVVQQKAGRVEPTRQLKGVHINDDDALEREADIMGDTAARGRFEPAPPAAELNSPPVCQNRTIQAKLGFEIEMLVLVDDNGRPVPEKFSLGRYGDHIELVVDHGPSVNAPTPETAESADYDLAAQHYKRWWYHEESDTWYASKADATNAHGEDIEEFYWDGDENSAPIRRSEANLGHVVKWRHEDSDTNYDTKQEALENHGEEEITRVYVDEGTGQHSEQHPFRHELGRERYASIIEMVTDAYAPETETGKNNIIRSMTDARNLANAIDARRPHENRFQLNDVAPNVSSRYYVGNDQQDRQTVNGSIQTNFGIDLATFYEYVQKTLAGNQGGRIAGYFNAPYSVKHHSDIEDDHHSEGDVVARELTAATANAATVIDAIPNEDDVALSHLKGLLVIVCQYLRMGKLFYTEGIDVNGYPRGAGLTKNFIPLMARTDISKMYRELVPVTEKALVGPNLDTIRDELLQATGRTADKALLNDSDEHIDENALNWGPIYDIGCETFVNNVFTQNTDGVTANLGNIREMGPEKVDSSAWEKAHDEESGEDYYYRPDDEQEEGYDSQWERPDEYREGAIFELRNMIPVGQGVDRFPPATWPGLARYYCDLLTLLHAPG